jgi:protein O-GlcNAc transferase
MATRQSTLQQARTALAGGHAQAAARKCAKLLVTDPRDIEARYLQGRCHAALGEWRLAIRDFDRVLAAQPGFYAALIDLGVAHTFAGESQQALPLLERARALDPRPAEVHFGLGLCLMEMGDLAGAMHAFREALARNPRFPDAHNNLGVVHDRLGQLAEAIQCFRNAIAIHADFAAARSNLEDALRRLNQTVPLEHVAEPAVSLEAMLAEYRLESDDSQLALKIAQLLESAGRTKEAAVLLAELARTQPLDADIQDALGALQHRRGKLDLALEHYARALSIDAERPATLLNQGLALESKGAANDAIDVLERALALRPRDGAINAALASCGLRFCNWALAARSLGELLALPQGVDFLHPFLILASGLEPAMQAESLRRRAPRSTCAVGKPARSRSAAPLRVGYVSMDFREHAVAHALAGVIDRHDRGRVTPIGISLQPPDRSDIGRRLRGSFDEFIDASSMSDREICARMREIQIDVAVDLAGHTVGARPGIFVERAAAVQVNFLGFPGSTGLQSMDYIVGDDIVLPAADEALYTERVLRMPACYLPFDDSRPIAERGANRAAAGLPSDGIVYCAFNNGYKITRDMFHVWMELLHAAPESVLWLRQAGAVTASNLLSAARACGISAERLVFAPFVASMEEHISRLRSADLFLDTTPYNAHTSAAEALWAGVPVISCLGRTFAGRVGASLLTTAGFPELICRDLDDYRSRAAELAASPAALSALRDKLAATRAGNVLFDTARYTRALESLLLRAARHG